MTDAAANAVDGTPAGAAAVTWRSLWLEAAERLGDRDDARRLAQEASGMEGADWILGIDRPAHHRAVAHFDSMVERRVAGEPLQHVLGSWGFRTLDLLCDRRVLIPRSETELVAGLAIEEVRRLLGGVSATELPLVVVDLGTGSGAIALSLLAELPLEAVVVWATDASPEALDVAAANAAGLGRPAAGLRLRRGHWFSALPGELAGQVAVVVANPPYVTTAEVLDRSVLDWEPHGALFAGPDGLDDLRVILAEAPRWLRPGGVVVVEHGAAQGPAVRALATAAGLVDIETVADLAGHDRALVSRRP